MLTIGTANPVHRSAVTDDGDAVASLERRRARRYPLSRWYLRPAAGRLAAALAPTSVRPVHLTFCGLLAAVGAGAVLLWQPEAMPVAAALVLVYWFFDRADGQLARRQGTASAWGAWLDGNIDELVDLSLHVAVAVVLARQVAGAWPWWLLTALLVGKYLFMYGLEHNVTIDDRRAPPPRPVAAFHGVPRRVYHLPGNADVRVHLLALALALAGGWLTAELALVAVYYNMRWMVRYVLVARRLGGLP